MHTDQGDTNDLNYMEQDTEYDTDHINSCSPLLTRGDESENVYDEMYSESDSSEGMCRVCWMCVCACACVRVCVCVCVN